MFDFEPIKPPGIVTVLLCFLFLLLCFGFNKLFCVEDSSNYFGYNLWIIPSKTLWVTVSKIDKENKKLTVQSGEYQEDSTWVSSGIDIVLPMIHPIEQKVGDRKEIFYASMIIAQSDPKQTPHEGLLTAEDLKQLPLDKSLSNTLYHLYPEKPNQ